MNQISSIVDEYLRAWEREYAATEQPIVVDFRSLVEMPKATERGAHLIHPYPAKLLTQIPYFFLRSRTLVPNESSVVADPFCGSGTVLLEAAQVGQPVLGADTNPLARLISRVKLTPFALKDLTDALDEVTGFFAVSRTQCHPSVVNIAHWYSPRLIREMSRLRAAIWKIENIRIREFMMVCFSCCARKLSYSDPRLSVPVKIDLSKKEKYGPHFHQLRSHIDFVNSSSAINVFTSIVKKNMSRLMDRNIVDVCFEIIEDAREIGSSTIKPHLVITSPPYLGAQKYIRTSSLSLGWLGIAEEGQLRPLEQKTIGREHYKKSEIGNRPPIELPRADELINSVAKYNPLRAHIALTYLHEMEVVLQSIHRNLEKGGHVVIVTGPNEICGRHFDTPAFIEALSHRSGFETSFSLIDHIRSRGLMTKRNKTASLIASEWVLVLRKQK